MHKPRIPLRPPSGRRDRALLAGSNPAARRGFGPPYHKIALLVLLGAMLAAAAPARGQSADLSVAKTAGTPSPDEGQALKYEVVVVNNGPDDATGIAITDSLPAGVTYLTATISQGSYDPGTGVWTVGDLANGATANIVFEVSIDWGTGGLTIDNTVSVSALDQVDPNGANDSATASIIVDKADDQLVNTYTSDAQHSSDVAYSANGSSVVVWVSLGQDGGDEGIYFQRYNANGSRAGLETRANTYTDHAQDLPAVSMDDTGRFVVVWQSEEQDQGSTWGIYAQRFGATGTPIGSEFLVNSTTTGDQINADVLIDGFGNIVFVWNGNGGTDASGIFMRRFDWNLASPTPETQLNPSTPFNQRNPSIAEDASGNFVVVWDSDHETSGAYGVYGQRFNSLFDPVGGEFQISSPSPSGQTNPSVAKVPDGTFVVVWESLNQDANPGAGVYGQRFDATGLTVGPEFRVNEEVVDTQADAQVATDSNGDFTVVWSSNGQDGNGYGTYVREYAANGWPLTGERLVNMATTGSQSNPAVAREATGDFTVVWSGNGPGDSEGVFLRRYSPTSAPTGSQISGIVFEDADFAGTASDYDGGGADAPLANVDVELYEATTDAYRGSATTGPDGAFAFVEVPEGSYKVRARSETIGDADTPPAGGFNATVTPASPQPRAEMTWADGGTLYGGQDPRVDDTDTADDAGPGDTWVAVAVGSSDVSGVNLGFAYNLIVNTDDDGNIDTVPSTQGSLRQFIKNANSIGTDHGTTASVSSFAIAPDDPGHLYYRDDGVPAQVTLDSLATTSAPNDAGIADIDPDFAKSWWSVRLASPFPAATDPILIDGTTQPGFVDTPIVELNGSDIGGSNDGLRIVAGSSTVRGLVVNRATHDGIQLDTNGGNIIVGNYVGTDPSGTIALANAVGGLRISTGNNVVGGDAPSDRNLISGNGALGLELSGANATGNRIVGNYIGTDTTGQADLGNTSHGIRIEAGAWGNTIGGTEIGAGNLIAGNGGSGVWITGVDTHTNLVQGNWIGVDASGAAALANHTGITIADSASVNTVGGDVAGAGNVLSGNVWRGILLDEGASRNRVEGNIVGLDVTGTVAVPNRIGVYLYQVSDNTIGGTTAGSGNIVSGNPDFGIYVVDALSTGNLVQGNTIGLDATRSAPVPNGTSGIEIIGAVGNVIGGLDPGAGNLITGNTGSGVSLVGQDPTDNAILSNSIFANGGLGIDLERDGVTQNDDGDVDTGANEHRNFPVITAATASAGVVDLEFGLDVPAGSYRVEFFTNASGTDSTGYGEGESMVGSVAVAHDGSGLATFAHTVAGAVGDTLTATCTECTDGSCTSFGSTSEFSAAVGVMAPVGNVDLDVSKTVNQALVMENDRITYTVLVTNRGPSNATGTVLVDALPVGLTFAGATVTHGNYNEASGRWSVGSLFVDETATLSLEAVVDPGTAGATLTNTASVSRVNEPDVDPSNDTSSVDVTVTDPQAGFVRAVATQPEPLAILPGAAAQETFRLTVHNLTAQPETVSGMTVTNTAIGPPDQSQRDQEWSELSLYRLLSLPSPTLQPVSSPTSFTAGEATFHDIDIECAAGDSLVFVIQGAATLDAGDADVLDLEIANETKLEFARPVPLNAEWPLAPEGYFTVNGMVAAQVALEPVGPGNLQVETTHNLALSIVLPANGFAMDELSRLNVVNVGTALPLDDLAAMDAWADEGDGVFDTASDAWLGQFSFTGDRWELTGLTYPVPLTGLRIFVSVDVSPWAQEGRTVQLRLPTLPDVGVGMLSGNDGPLDTPLDNPFALTISTVDRITLTTVAIPGGTVRPGETGVALLHLVATNSYTVPKRVSAISFTNTSVGPGSQSEIDRQLQQLSFRIDGDDDEILGDLTVDPLAGTGIFESGNVTLDGLSWDLPPGESRHAFLTANVSLLEAADGDVIGTVIAEDLDIAFEDPTRVTASWPLDSGSEWTIDGMVARQITNHGAEVATLGPGDGPVPALDVTIPANGYLADQLNAVRVVNLGSASDVADLEELHLWRDDGNGQFDGPSVDLDLGAMSWDGAGWDSAFLTEDVTLGGARLFVSIDVASTPTDSATVRLSIPIDGLVMASGNDGPTDEPLENLQGQLISASPLLSTIALSPAVSTLGRTVQARMVVRNVGVEDVQGITPSVLSPVGDGGLAAVSGPMPASFDLSVGAVDTFTWSFDAAQLGVVRLVGNAQGVGGSTFLTRESTPSESNDHLVLQEATELNLFAVGTMPTSANRDESEIVAFNLTFTNPAGPSGSDALLRRVRMRLADDAGAPIVPADVLSRVVVSEGANVYLVKTSLETTGSDVDLNLLTPPRITTREPVTVSISFDLVSDTNVPRFHMLLQDDTSISADDAVSGNPVALNLEEGAYPISSGIVNLMAGATELQVTGTSLDTLRIEPGQTQVTLLDMDLENLDTGLLTSDVQLAGFTVEFADTNGTVLSDISPWIDRIRVHGPDETHLTLPTLTGGRYDLDLSPLLFLPAGTPLGVSITADFHEDAPSGAFRLRLPDAELFQSTDANSGDPVTTTFPVGTVTGSTVLVEMPADVAMVEGHGSLPATVTIGSTDLSAMSIAVRHPGATGTARLRWGGLALHVRDQGGAPVAPATVLSGLRVMRDSVLLASVPEPPTTGDTVGIGWPDVIIAPGETATIDVVIDINAVAPATSLELRAQADEILLADDNTGVVVSVKPETGTTLPISSGVSLLRVPPRQLMVQLENRLPTVLAADGREIVAGVFTLTNTAPGGSGAIQLESLGLTGADRQFAAQALGRAVTVVSLYHAGSPWASAGDLDESDVDVTLTGAQPLELEPGDPLDLELRVTLAARDGVENIRFGVRSDDIGVVQPQSALLQIAVAPGQGQEFPLWTGAGTVAATDFASSYANFPNPFAAGRENTSFVFYLDEPGDVTLTIWTSRGEKVITLLRGVGRGAGLHQEDVWDGRNGRGRAVINDVFLAELVVDYESGRSDRAVRKVAVIR